MDNSSSTLTREKHTTKDAVGAAVGRWCAANPLARCAEFIDLPGPVLDLLSAFAGQSACSGWEALGGPTLEGSFSAVSKPTFASKYALELGSI